MGNTLSKKIENNGKIWGETYRNFKIGCLFGLLLTLLKYRRALFRIYSQYMKQQRVKDTANKPKLHKVPKFKNQQDLFVSMALYFVKFPLFITVFSILFKKLIRMNYISYAMDINMAALPIQKYSISLMSFLLAYSMQKNVGIFHWKWALLLLIRSLYGLIRCITPKQYQIFTVQDLHTILAPIMGCFFVCKYSKSLPQSIKSTYEACYVYDQQQYINTFASNHKKQPSCCSKQSYHETIGSKIEPNCFKAYIKDALYVVFPHSFSFFMKLHTIAAIIGGPKFVKDLKSKPLGLLLRIIRNAIKSCIYWAVGVHLAVRCCSCFNKMIVKKLYRVMDYVMNTQNIGKYEYHNDKNTALLFFLTAIVGRYNVLAEPKGRQSEIVISLMWYELVHVLRINCNLETNDDDKYHWVLGANSFVSILFAAAIAINMYVYCRDATYLKSMERRLIQSYLIK